MSPITSTYIYVCCVLDAGIGEAVEGELAAAAAPAPGGHAIYVQRISVPEYEQKGHDYTKQAIAALLQSEDYQRKNKSCHRLVHSKMNKRMDM